MKLRVAFLAWDSRFGVININELVGFEMLKSDSSLLFLDFRSSGFDIFRYCGSCLSENFGLMGGPGGGELGRRKGGVDCCSWLEAKGEKVGRFCG